jgi:hypothetical protein
VITPDLIETLERIAKEAKVTKQRIAKGETPKGSSALQRIQYEAEDAIQRHREEARR